MLGIHTQKSISTTAEHGKGIHCAVEDDLEDVSGEEDDADDEDFGKSKRKAPRPSPQSARPQHSRRGASVSAFHSVCSRLPSCQSQADTT